MPYLWSAYFLPAVTLFAAENKVRQIGIEFKFFNRPGGPRFEIIYSKSKMTFISKYSFIYFFTFSEAMLAELTDMELMGVPMLHSVIQGVAEQ